MRTGLLVAFLVLAVPISASAETFNLPYNLMFHPTGRISGTFGGVAVLGTFEATTAEMREAERTVREGVFTLTVDGKAFVMGLYQCVPVECVLVGEEILGQPKAFLVVTRSMRGTVRGSLRNLYATHAAWVSGVEKWGKMNLQTMPLDELIAAAARLRASSGFRAAAGLTDQANRQAKNGITS